MAILPLENRIPESEYLAALDLISRYKAQIEEETNALLNEPFEMPRDGDRIQLIEVPKRMRSLKEGDIWTVGRVLDRNHDPRDENTDRRIFLINKETGQRPMIRTNETTFRILPA